MYLLYIPGCKSWDKYSYAFYKSCEGETQWSVIMSDQNGWSTFQMYIYTNSSCRILSADLKNIRRHSIIEFQFVFPFTWKFSARAIALNFLSVFRVREGNMKQRIIHQLFKREKYSVKNFNRIMHIIYLKRFHYYLKIKKCILHKFLYLVQSGVTNVNPSIVPLTTHQLMGASFPSTGRKSVFWKYPRTEVGRKFFHFIYFI